MYSVFVYYSLRNDPNALTVFKKYVFGFEICVDNVVVMQKGQWFKQMHCYHSQLGYTLRKKNTNKIEIIDTQMYM